MGEPREFQHPALVTYYLLLATSFPFAGSAVQWRGLLWRALGAAVLEQFSGRDPPPTPICPPPPSICDLFLPFWLLCHAYEACIFGSGDSLVDGTELRWRRKGDVRREWVNRW